ncbi:MAG: ABC transporter transmembrane domain-containing protein [Eubacteriales bacterium]
MNKGFGPPTTNNPNKNSSQKLDKKTRRGVILRLGGYMLKYWHLFLFAIIITLLSNQLSLMGPEFSGSAIDAISAEGGVDFPAVWENVLKMLVCYLASGVLSYILAVVMIKLSQKIIYTMRRQLFEKLTSLPVSYFDTHATGDIISRISYDIDTVNSSLSHDLVQVMSSIYTVVGSAIFMWRISGR